MDPDPPPHALTIIFLPFFSDQPSALLFSLVLNFFDYSLRVFFFAALGGLSFFRNLPSFI